MNAKSSKTDDKKEKYRKIFLSNLVTDGLEIEIVKHKTIYLLFK